MLGSMSVSSVPVPSAAGARRRWRQAVAVAALVLVAWYAFVCGAAYATGVIAAGDRFSVVAWEIQHLPERPLQTVGEWFRGAPPQSQQLDAVRRFFALASEIAQVRYQADQPGDQATARAKLAELLRERNGLRLQVQATIEGWVTDVLRREGVVTQMPLFPGWSTLWPPVNVVVGEPPDILSRSPRTTIELAGQRLLVPGLSLDRIEQIERQQERRPNTSAYIEQLGGYSTYPAIVNADESYFNVVSTIAHEWTHNYLFFHPLGRAYGASSDMALVNETVADLVGNGVATIVTREHPLQPPSPAKPASTPTSGAYLGVSVEDSAVSGPGGAVPGVKVLSVERDGPAERAGLRPGDVITNLGGAPVRQVQDLVRALGMQQPGKPITVELYRDGVARDVAVTPEKRPPSPPAFDYAQEMRQLRTQVDALLKQGKVTEAEQLMDKTRLVFVAHGYAIREINQAFFAFRGTYGDTPESSNPLGPLLQQLFRKEGSVGAFLHAMQNVTRPGQVRALEGGGQP